MVHRHDGARHNGAVLIKIFNTLLTTAMVLAHKRSQYVFSLRLWSLLRYFDMQQLCQRCWCTSALSEKQCNVLLKGS